MASLSLSCYRYHVIIPVMGSLINKSWQQFPPFERVMSTVGVIVDMLSISLD